SEARELGRADLIFWIGPNYEAFLQRTLASLSKRIQVIELGKNPGVTMLPAREGGAWEPDADEPRPSARSRGAETELDGHMFLDPNNAKAIVRAAAAGLSSVDKENEARYRANSARMIERIDALDSEMALVLGPVQKRPFIVFHDAYQYLERHFGLIAV